MPKSEPRNVCISTVWRKTEATLLRRTGRAPAACRSICVPPAWAGPASGSRATICRKLWGEAALLSDRFAAAEPGKAQKAVLVAARVFFERAAAALQSPPRGV